MLRRTSAGFRSWFEYEYPRRSSYSNHGRKTAFDLLSPSGSHFFRAIPRFSQRTQCFGIEFSAKKRGLTLEISGYMAARPFRTGSNGARKAFCVIASLDTKNFSSRRLSHFLLENGRYRSNSIRAISLLIESTGLQIT